MEHGNECGLRLDEFTEFEEGDEIECLKIVYRTQTEVVMPGISGVVVHTEDSTRIEHKMK